MPYTELLFDSEFTPIENEDGTVNSRQSDLSLTLGVSARPVGTLTALRIGGFANRDVARLSDKPTEYGGKLEWNTRQAVNTALLWTTLGDIQVFADTSDDDASDLRLRASGETRLSMPLARSVSANWRSCSIEQTPAMMPA